MTYQQVAYEVMKLYFTDFTEEELKNCINNAYDSKFDTEEIAVSYTHLDVYKRQALAGPVRSFKCYVLKNV